MFAEVDQNDGKQITPLRMSFSARAKMEARPLLQLTVATF